MSMAERVEVLGLSPRPGLNPTNGSLGRGCICPDGATARDYTGARTPSELMTRIWRLGSSQAWVGSKPSERASSSKHRRQRAQCGSISGCTRAINRRHLAQNTSAGTGSATVSSMALC